MIDYEPIGWIDRETARTTPTSAANFNHMDEGIEQATNFANETREKVDELESRQSIQEARMDTIASLPSGSVSTKGDAELNDIRSGYDGSVYTTAGNAVRGQARTLQGYIDALEAANAVLSGQIENLVQTSSEATVGNEELIDIRTGYDGTVYNTAGTAVREQISAVITKVENTDNTKTVTQEEYDALSEEEKTNGTIYFITDGGGVRQAATVEYDNERSGLTGTTVQAAIDEAAEVVAGMQSQITELNSSRIGTLVGVNIDQMPSNNQFGTYWLNVGANTYTGTKPTNASGQGFLIVKRQTDTYVRQTYIGVTGYGFQNRYWDGSTWTEWSDMSRYPQVESFSGTPSANGNINHIFPKKVVVLAAWSNVSDQTVNAYPSGGVTTGGSVSWWFHVRQANASHGVVASEVTITCIYIMLST